MKLEKAKKLGALVASADQFESDLRAEVQSARAALGICRARFHQQLTCLESLLLLKGQGHGRRDDEGALDTGLVWQLVQQLGVLVATFPLLQDEGHRALWAVVRCSVDAALVTSTRYFMIV